MATNQNIHPQGAVKDPEHDGRLKENREAGQTKGTTPGNKARAEEPGKEPSQASHGSGSDDLKAREYRDEKGEAHHHTRTYMEQRKGE